jgi:signal recognition particle receptor subunit beta
LARAFKIVVTGPFNSGKTTFIQAISEIDVVATDRKTRVSSKKSKTTVAMDFGRITLRDGDVLHLYGTPGQERFDFMWEILSEGMLGYVVLIDGTDQSSLDDGARMIAAFENMSQAPFVIAITRADSRSCLSVVDIGARVAPNSEVDVVTCDARKVGDVKDVLLTLLERVLERADEDEEVEAG